MNYDDATLIDELAAQYALGTLRGPARRRFERLCHQDPSACLALRRWEDRFLDLGAQILPVHPSALVWSRIRQRVRADRNRSVRVWSVVRWATAAGVAALAAAILWSTMLVPVERVATVTDQQQGQLWRIEARPNRKVLHVEALPALPQDITHAYELWALPPEGAAPVSLGLMPQAGTSELPLNDAQRDALAAAEQVAISLEPVNGSPTGAPTGPVMFIAAVLGNG